MKSFPSIFIIVFIGIAVSWFCLLVVGANTFNVSKMETSLKVGRDDVIIPADEGMVATGKQVYRELGCVTCHTQQVRRPGYGGDFDRKWGSRQSVPRDYLMQEHVMLGSRRMGPDLSNVGARHDAAWFYSHLYNPGSKANATNMPSYSYLFREKEITDGASAASLELSGNDTMEPGMELVPTDKAVALVAYLQSLNLDYDLPESKRIK